MVAGSRPPSFLAALASALLIIASACQGAAGPSTGSGGAPSSGTTSTEPIKIGAILGISGRFAFVGTDQQDALKLAQEEINGAGGIAKRQLDLVIYDDEVDEKKSGPLANRLIFEDKVVAIIGPSITVPAINVGPIVEKAKMPNFTLTSRALWEEEKYKYVYHTTPREEIEVSSMLDFIKKTLGKTKIAVLYDKQPYGTGNFAHIQRLASQNGLELVGSDTGNNTDTDVLPQLTRLRATGAEALILWVGDPMASAATKQIRQIGWNVDIVGSSAISGPRFIELAGSAADGVYTNAVYNTDQPTPTQKRFFDNFKKKYNRDASQFAAYAYDSIYVLKAAIEKAGGKTDGDSIVEGVNTIGKLDSVVATFEFSDKDHNGLGLRPIFVFQAVKDGKWVYVAKKG